FILLLSDFRDICRTEWLDANRPHASPALRLRRAAACSGVLTIAAIPVTLISVGFVGITKTPVADVGDDLPVMGLVIPLLATRLGTHGSVRMVGVWDERTTALRAWS